MLNISSRLCLVNLILVLLLLSISCGTVTNSSPGTFNNADSDQWAIIVGVGDYASLDLDVRYADDDARSIFARLEPIFGKDHIILLVNSDATKTGFTDAVYDWLDPNEDENDLILLFLAGHGNSEYFQLYDSTVGSHGNVITPSELNTCLGILESKTIAIILDFCESGSYSNDISNDGRVTISGCTEREKCWQEKAYEHGIFSYYLVQAFDHLHTVDINNDQSISIEELFTYTNLKVTSEFQNYPPPSPQHPYISDYYEGDLILFTYSFK